MFKVGDYQDDMQVLVGYLRDAGFNVDIRPSLSAIEDAIAYLEGKFSTELSRRLLSC